MVDYHGGPVVKNPPANAGDMGLTPGLGRSPGGGHGNPLKSGEFHGQRSLAGGLQSMGSQRVKHNVVTKQQQ